MTTIKKNCLNCNEEFNAPIREVNRGNGKFCSLKCSGEYNGKMRPKPQPNVECAWCHKLIYRNKSKAALSKSGLYFCCDDHKNQAQRIDGLKELSLPHYGSGKTNYRGKVFGTSKRPKKCELCGFDQHEAAIIVHHKDRNRDNNADDNLQVLCANCHAIEHWSEQL
jgi:hypothetical protein